MSILGFIFNCCEHDTTLPDASYQEEYDTLVKRGVRVFLFDLAQLEKKEPIILPKTLEKIYLIYRGWMLSEEQYDTLYETLLEQKYQMVVDPYQYRECHYLDYWYTKLSRLTAKSVYSHGIPSDESILQMLSKFGNQPIIVKDYVKSRKHEWYESCFIEDASNTEDAMKIIHNFIERQGDKFSGGLVLREYLDINKNGVHFKNHLPVTEEVRIFCYKNDPICFISYWSGDMWQMDRAFLDIIDRCAVLESPFYTIDLARTNSGKWVLIEVGDGQISHLRGYDVGRFYDGFLSLLMRDYDLYM